VDELRERALSGALEEDLGWREVRAGEVIDVPPGTIHAIGGGLTLYEIQQPSDLTYRLFDYGRGRELHLEKSLQVAVRRPMDGAVAPRSVGVGRWELLRSPSFVVERLEVPAARAWSGGPAALTVVAGDLRVGGEPVRLGETVVVDGPVELGGAGDVLVGRSA